jgi:prepilin-type N-terminal cleavage/methylation domain-containing protein
MDRERGFSLIEIMVAFLIITIVITVSLTAFVQRNAKLQQASELVLAYQALANEAEYQRRIPWGDLQPVVPPAPGQPLPPAASFAESNTAVLAPLAPFGTFIKVESSKPGVKDVTMTVRWGNGKREARLMLKRVDTGGTNLW